MGIDLQLPGLTELRPRITVMGVGGAGGNAINNMIESGLEGVEFIAANTDAQALSMSGAGVRVQLGIGITEGLGAGSRPDIGAAAAEEALDEIRAHLDGVHMLFITAGMGGGTGTGAAPIIARTAKDLGILTVAVVTKPFEFEGQRRMRIAQEGIDNLAQHVDTIIVIPNQNLFRIASEKTTFADAFLRADEVLKSGVSCITDLMIKEGLINLDFADVRTVMQNMGTALMGTGEAEGDKRALQAAEAAISNPLLGDISMRGAKGLLVSITGSFDMTLYEVEEAASKIRREVDPDENPDINIIVGATFDTSLQNRIRVSVVATGIKPSADLAHLSLGASAVTKGRGDGRLTDRLFSSHQSQSESYRGQPQGQDRRGAPRPAMEEPPSRRSILEPKPRPPVESAPENSHRSQAYDAPPSFEPAHPARSARPPRRPLTFQDFPDMQSDHEGRAAANGQRPRGFFDWMSGRTRQERGDSQAKSVASAPQRRDEKNGVLRPVGPRSESHHRLAPSPGEADRVPPKDAPPEEAIEIPDFFKKPLN